MFFHGASLTSAAVITLLVGVVVSGVRQPGEGRSSYGYDDVQGQALRNGNGNGAGAGNGIVLGWRNDGYFRGIGERCVEKSYWERDQRGTCDENRGFSCQDYPEYGGYVCACSSPFVYDPHGDECRRRLGGTCPHPDLSLLRRRRRRQPAPTPTPSSSPPMPMRMARRGKPAPPAPRPLQWFDKCQENAECVIVSGISGNMKGVCHCKTRFDFSYGRDFCE